MLICLHFNFCCLGLAIVFLCFVYVDVYLCLCFDVFRFGCFGVFYLFWAVLLGGAACILFLRLVIVLCVVGVALAGLI